MEENAMVQGEPNGEVDATSTPAGGVATTATPSPTPSDAEKLAAIETARQEFESKLKATNDDLNKMKSTFQRNEAAREKEWKDKQRNYEQEIERLKVSTMDEDERKTYESTATARRLQELEFQLSELESDKSQTEAMLKANNYFLSRGVPVDVLPLDDGYEALWNAGMNWIDEDYKKLKTKPAPPTSTTPVLPPQAPPVVTTTNTPPFNGYAWSDLVGPGKRFQSEEEVYRGVETGQLDRSIIPTRK